MIVVTGATGTIGSLIVHQLHHGKVRVRAFVRDAARARDLLGDVDLATGDFTDPDSLRTAFAGADAVLLSSRNHPAQAEHEASVIAAAASSGVRRIVKLSTVGAEPGSPAAFWDHHGRAEQHLWQAGVPAVCLRSNFYMSNLLAAAANVQTQGMLFAPAAGAHVAMIDPRDVAHVAVVVLTSSGHDGQTYTLTGPDAITYDRVAEELSEVTGRQVSFVPVPDPTAHQAMLGNGMPPWIASQVIATFALLRQGAAAAVTSTVRELTGRAPRSIGEFLRDHAASFRAPLTA